MRQMHASSEGMSVESLRSAAGDLDQRIREFARKRPIVSVLGALLLGFVTARITSRGRA